MRLQIFKEKEWTMEENNGIRLMKGYRKIDVEELFVEDVYWVGINLRSELYFILNFFWLVKYKNTTVHTKSVK